MALLPLADAQQRLLDMASAMPAETLALSEAIGRYLAEDLVAKRSQPTADLSAMDGIAIRWTDMPGPWTLIGESAAGRAFQGRLGPGEAATISTGAVVPEGADTVVVREDIGVDAQTVTLEREGPAGQGSHIRNKASDFDEGSTLLRAGSRLGAAAIGLAGMAGHDRAAVHRLPHIAIVSTGSELVPLGEPLTSIDQIPSTNGTMLAALFSDQPCNAGALPAIPDDLDAIAKGLEQAAGEADILVTIGGASVGDHDLVRPALERLGANLDFWRVAIKPGKPIIAGKLGDTLVIGLPGNPVSAFVTAHLFLLPLIHRMAGSADPLPRTGRAILTEGMRATGNRAEFPRARIADGRITPMQVQDSAALSALAMADALIVRPIAAAAAEAGDSVDYLDIR